MNSNSWNNHYTRERSMLSFPDENLVRLLKKHLNTIEDISKLKILDLGCGSGRHLTLFNKFNIGTILGFDISFNALKLSELNKEFTLIQSDNKFLPVKNNSLDIVVSWGSLHYNIKNDLPVMLKEIKRVLKPGGVFFATLRTTSDTYMRKGTHTGNNTWSTDLDDIKGTTTSFYSEVEMKNSFKIFKEYNYGIIERSEIGNIKKIISHWVISAKNY